MSELEGNGGANHETLESMYPGGQFRLAELSVCNWANFKGIHTAKFDPGGTLVSGLTGAGKSSFIDGLQLLFLAPNKTHFNIAAAQGDSKDRDKISYCRGVYGQTSDSQGRTIPKFKREGDVLSGVRGLFRTEDGSIEVTLVCLMRTPAGAVQNGEVKHQYLVANRNVSLKEIVEMVVAYSGTSRWAGLTKMFDQDPAVEQFSTYDSYESLYRRALRIEDDKAAALLFRAMGLKKIDNLTDLVRKLVLEDPDTPEKAAAAIREFENLNLIHAELESARNRHKVLKSLPALSLRLQDSYADRESVQQQQAAFDGWFARQRADMLKAVERRVKLDVEQLNEQKAQAKSNADALHRQRMDIEQLYRDKGGDRIETLKESLRVAQRSETSTITRCAELQLLVANAGGTWPEKVDADSFILLKREFKERGFAAAENESKLEGRRDGITISKDKIEGELASKRKELAVLKERPGSSIDYKYQEMRDALSGKTGVPQERMPFIGELIEIKKSQEAWRGAIERALGFLRLRLVIGSADRDVISHYINDNDMKRRVGFEVVSGDTSETSFGPLSFLSKLEWADHQHKYWLRRFLADHSLDCVDSVEKLKEFSMTQSGLIRYRKGSYDKNDAYSINDRGNWYIGFSNEGRRKELESEIAALNTRLLDLLVHRKDVETQLRQLRTVFDVLRQVGRLDFEDIDVLGAHARCISLQEDIAAIEKSSDDLSDLQKKLNDCIDAWDRADTLRGEVQTQLGSATARLAEVRDAIVLQEARTRGPISEVISLQLAAKVPLLTVDTIANAEHHETEGRRKLEREARAVEGELTRIKTELATIIGTYKGEFKGAAVDLPDHNASDNEVAHRRVVAEWVDHFDELVRSKMPELKERFETSLRRQATQALTVIFQSIESQSEAIEERIEEINRVLMKAEFLPGLFMQMETSDLQNEHVKAFQLQWDNVRKKAATSSDPEEHFKALKELIQTLRVATDPNSKNNVSSLPLLDARYRKAFTAPLVSESGQEGDRFGDTKGRSGGEKEGFSGFVVAAALAYVLTPQGHSRPTYGTVFLDEAFSNTSDERAARVMQVFKEFGLHLNLITPFKQIEVSSRAMAKAVVVEMNKDKDSRLMDITWENAREQQCRLAEREAAERGKPQ